MKLIKLFGFISLLFMSMSICSANDITGNYELTGVMEMAGAITLMPNHHYQAQFSYGAADWIEEGNWALEKNAVVLSNAHFKIKNSNDLSLFLPSGTRFTLSSGKMTAYGPNGHITFINPNKTPSRSTGPGEGRMRIQGTVVKLDAETLEVKTKKECMYFDVNQLSPAILRAVKKSKNIDIEIPYSAIVAGGGC